MPAAEYLIEEVVYLTTTLRYFTLAIFQAQGTMIFGIINPSLRSAVPRSSPSDVGDPAAALQPNTLAELKNSAIGNRKSSVLSQEGEHAKKGDKRDFADPCCSQEGGVSPRPTTINRKLSQRQTTCAIQCSASTSTLLERVGLLEKRNGSGESPRKLGAEPGE